MKATLNLTKSWTGSAEAIWTSPPRIKARTLRCPRRGVSLSVPAKGKNHERSPDRVVKTGSAGDPPAPVGDPPTRTAARKAAKSLSPLNRTSARVPSDESSDKTGNPPVLAANDFPHTLSKTRELAAKALESASPFRALRLAVSESLAGGR